MTRNPRPLTPPGGLQPGLFLSQTLRVLLIEHDPADARLIGRMLGAVVSPGFEVEYAENLQTGLEKLKSGPFDVLLVDISLPGTDVFNAVSAAIAAAPEVPIIALGSSYTPPATLDTLRVAVVDYFVKSTLEPEPLIQAILRQAARKRLFAGPARDAAATPRPPEDGAERRTVRVLIVEDNPGDFALVRQMLASVETVHFEITHATTLSSALEMLQAGKDVVLLDLNLPDSQDLATLRRLRAQDPAVPTIVLTVIDDRQRAVEALSNGANDYFVKERLDAHLLERAILRWVKPAEAR